MWASIGTGNFQFTSLEKTEETGKVKKKILCIFLLANFCEENFAKTKEWRKQIEKKSIHTATRRNCQR
jgi:hypothetical protein